MLAAYLPEEGAANRDIGAYQGGFMRFGAKHNDIYPVLADMMRWATNLPSRRELVGVQSRMRIAGGGRCAP